jgi:hypothetical protein
MSEEESMENIHSKQKHIIVVTSIVEIVFLICPIPNIKDERGEAVALKKVHRKGPTASRLWPHVRLIQLAKTRIQQPQLLS